MEFRLKGKSFLYYACKHGQYEIAEALIRNGTLDTLCIWNPKNSVVDVAIRKCQWKILDLLLRSGAAIYTVDNRIVKLLPSCRNYEPLSLATQNPFSKLCYPISKAASLGYYSIFRYWRASDYKNYTIENLLTHSKNELLFEALCSRNPLLIEHLLDMGIDCPEHDGSSIVELFFHTVTNPVVLNQYGGKYLTSHIYLHFIQLHYDPTSYFSRLTPQMLRQIYMCVRNSRWIMEEVD
jgi:hypothetical protein